MLKVNNLNKQYPSFKLSNVSFELKPGCIMGFIGRNGAGKTTTLKAIMNLCPYDNGGQVLIFDKNMKKDEIDIKQEIGFSLCETNSYMNYSIKQLVNVTKRFYKQWDDNLFNQLCSRFGLDQNKKLEELSSGMKVKYSLAIALSHHAKLLILDEPTSGLDPVSRDEIVELFLEFVKDGNRSILFSTHITSDLEKCANYITYINNGNIIYSGSKADFINSYLMVSGDENTLNHKDKIIGLAIRNGKYEGLIKINDKSLFNQSFVPSLEQIMVCLERKEHESITL